MLRDELRAGTPLGQKADSYTRHGQLVPDSVVVALVDHWLKSHTDGFVFDGFPRTLMQAQSLDQMLATHRSHLEAVFFFDVPYEVVLDRILHRVGCRKCGRIFSRKLHFANGEEHCPVCGGVLITRADDTAEALVHRMAEYQEKTHPLVELYRSRGLLHELRGTERPEKVFAEISTILEAA